jgi:hypothetical protein
MSTLDRLLDSLSRVYDTTPDPVLGIRLTYLSGQMRWTIADDVLTTTVIGGVGESLVVDLSQHTLSTLSVYLASQPGYVVLFLDDTGMSSLSALSLVPGSGDIATSNGDHLYIARNPTWTLLSAMGRALDDASAAIVQMPAEMSTTTADGGWLDLLGSYYAVPRQLGEQDPQYGLRIPAEVILPRQNNTAIAAALEMTTGQIASCDDAPIFGNPEPAYNGIISHTGSPHFYNSTAKLILNLFDVAIGYDLLGGFSPSDYAFFVRRQVDRLRAAGTHLRVLTLTPSVMGDRFVAPTDALSNDTSVVIGLTGTGQSFNSAIAVGFFPLLLVPLSFSANRGQGVLSSAIQLTGTGESFDVVAVAILAGTGSSANAGDAVLKTGAPIALAGTGGSIDSVFGTLGSVVIFNGVSSSSNSATAALRIGAGFIGTGSSANSGVLFRYVGPGASANSAVGALSSAIRLTGTGADSQSATAALSTAIRLVATPTSADSATGTLTFGIFSSEFDPTEFQV